MGRWFKTEKHPDNVGLNIDYMILDKYINEHKSPELTKDYVNNLAKELKVTPYDVGRVLGYNPNELSPQLIRDEEPIKAKSPLDLANKINK
jgi:hypothetical protein